MPIEEKKPIFGKKQIKKELAGMPIEQIIEKIKDAVRTRQLKERELLEFFITHGLNSRTLSARGIDVMPLIRLGVPLKIIKAIDYNLRYAKELRDARHGAKELKDAGYSAEDLKRAGYSALDLRRAGYDAKDLIRLGFSQEEVNKAMRE
jgi:hypothetical protein